MDGLNAGLNTRRSTVLNTARSIDNDVTRTIRNALDINFPSLRNFILLNKLLLC